MVNNPDKTESHEHKSPQCKTSDAGAICHEQLFNCVHLARSSP